MHELQQSMRATLAAETIRRTGRLAMRVYGTSMLGGIWPGDEAIFETCAAAEVELGDVLLYRRDERLVVHRVIEIRRARDEFEFVTRGDNQRRCDPPVNAEEILGRAVLLRRTGDAPRAISRRRSSGVKLACWFSARSTLITEIALRLHTGRQRLRAMVSSQLLHTERHGEVRS